MDRKNIATRYQQPTENLLMDIATLAKKTPNLIDLSIGDPDLITDERIIEQAANDAKNGHTKYTASDGSEAFIEAVIQFYQSHYQLSFSTESSPGHSWRSTRDVPCLTSDSKSWR